jgi:DNA transposition AAA+ family ATPase
VYVQALETWKDSLFQIAEGLALALGVGRGKNATVTMRQVTECLKARPLTIFIDDAQEGGTALLKVVKTLVDQTGAKLILSMYPTKWRKLLSALDDPHQEARQVLGRGIKPVLDAWIGGVDAEDCEVYLREAGVEGAEAFARDIAAQVARDYNLRTLADAVEAARLIARREGLDVTTVMIRAQLVEMGARR